MVNLGVWMQLREMYQKGMSKSQIARELGLDRKTVRKYLQQPPQGYRKRSQRAMKVDPYRGYLRERWEQGVHNAQKLCGEIRKRGYAGGGTQVRRLLAGWRKEQVERAYVRFESEPGQQSQLDWAHFGNWLAHRLYAFALTLGYSRMRYVEFTHRQDIETLMTCLVHAFHYLGGVSEVMLTDNMKTVVLERSGEQVRWNPRLLDFASYYGFVPRACWPYRPQTKGKIERTIGFLRGNFWSGVSFTSLADLNQQAWAWMEAVNRQPHATTREAPYDRLARENLRSIAGHPDYDTSYVAYREVAKDCLLSYRANRYSVPHQYVGKRVVVKEPVDGLRIQVCYQEQTIAEHPLCGGRGEMVIDPEHYRGLPRSVRPRAVVVPVGRELMPGPGVGRHFVVPEVEVRPLVVYEEVSYVAAS